MYICVFEFTYLAIPNFTECSQHWKYRKYHTYVCIARLQMLTLFNKQFGLCEHENGLHEYTRLKVTLL